MLIRDHIVRVENIKTMQMMDAAKIDHRVIAAFLTSEGMPIETSEVTAVLKNYDALGIKRLSQKKSQVLILAKMQHFSDSELPCPLTY